MIKKTLTVGALAMAFATSASAAGVYVGANLNLLDTFKPEVKYTFTDQAKPAAAKIVDAPFTHKPGAVKKMGLDLAVGYRADMYRAGLRLTGLGKGKTENKKPAVIKGGMGALFSAVKPKMGFALEGQYLMPVGPGTLGLGGYFGSTKYEYGVMIANAAAISAKKSLDVVKTFSNNVLGLSVSYIYPINAMFDVEGGLKLDVYSSTSKKDEVKELDASLHSGSTAAKFKVANEAKAKGGMKLYVGGSYNIAL